MAWEINGIHSKARLAVHDTTAGLMQGYFTAMDGCLYVDEQNPVHSWVTAEIDAASISTGNAARDAHLRSAEFLDTATYPAITFKSNRIEHIANREYRVSGDLTLHGVTRPVTFAAGFYGHSTLELAQHAIFTARVQIPGDDFGFPSDPFAAAGEIEEDAAVTIELELLLVSQVPRSQRAARQAR